jgi:ribosomal protein S20
MPKIQTYNELILRINELNSLKNTQEVTLKNDAKELYQKFQLKNIIKETVHDLANDTDFRESSFKAAKNVATDFVVGRLFNKNNSVKGFVTTILIEKLVTPLIEKNKEKIVSFVTHLFTKREKKQEE